MAKLKKADNYLRNALNYMEQTYIKNGALYELESKIIELIQDNLSINVNEYEEQMETEIADLEKQIVDFEEEISEKDKEIECCETKIDTMEDEIIELKDEITNLEDTIEELKSQLNVKAVA